MTKNYSNSPFIFGEYNSDVSEIKFGYILNKQETLWILIKYKDLFEQKLNENFDPIKLINEFGTPSQYWKIILSDDLLSGLLYGYGLKNSKLFVLRKHLRKENIHAESFFSQAKIFASPKNINLENLPLPKMTSFQLPFDNDPVMREYQNQRERIQKNLNRKNLEEKLIEHILQLN